LYSVCFTRSPLLGRVLLPIRLLRLGHWRQLRKKEKELKEIATNTKDKDIIFSTPTTLISSVKETHYAESPIMMLIHSSRLFLFYVMNCVGNCHCLPSFEEIVTTATGS
jgi:hypothetical protein